MLSNLPSIPTAAGVILPVVPKEHLARPIDVRSLRAFGLQPCQFYLDQCHTHVSGHPTTECHFFVGGQRLDAAGTPIEVAEFAWTWDAQQAAEFMAWLSTCRYLGELFIGNLADYYPSQ